MQRSVYPGLAFVAVAAALYFALPRSTRWSVVDDEDCQVSECGSDGVALSRYAG